MNNGGGHYSERERERERESQSGGWKKKEEQQQETDYWCRLLGTSSLKEGQCDVHAME
jgi:hypothetical protein